MSLAFHVSNRSHAVLQRDRPLPIRGYALPQATVRVCFADEIHTVTADGSGRWCAEFSPRSAGGPFSLVAECGIDRLVADGLYVGEVWLCSGQSNMEWTLAQCGAPETEIHGARFPELHLLQMPRRPALEPVADTDAKWVPCSPTSAKNFSAVAYHFGRRLLAELGNVHIGLIDASWGGTQAITWTARPPLERDPSFASDIARLRRVQTFAPAQPPQFHLDTGDTGSARGWARPDLDDRDWPRMMLPTLWQQAGLHCNGAVWFRRTICLPEAMRGRELMLELGVIDDFDRTFVEGIEVGSITDHPDAWKLPRRYVVPASLTQNRERLTIAVRVFDRFGMGGLTGPNHAMRLRISDAPWVAPVPLAGSWAFAVERALPLPPTEDPNSGIAEGQTVASGLFNGMIAPLAGTPLCGALWYQGESDTPRADRYERTLLALIESWRSSFLQPELPFFIVQLAPFYAGSVASDAAWADLRSAQGRVGDSLPGCGWISTMDCGDPHDIHPLNKQTVGHRLAHLALNRIHDRTFPCMGPRYCGHQIDGDSLILHFSDADGGLRSGDHAPIREFELAGSDTRFHPAEAVIESPSSVRLRSKAVAAPVAARHAWRSAPSVNLVNAHRLPASPFTTA